MCLTPITIDNINYKSPLAKNPRFAILHNCDNSKIEVPCGHCAVCVALRQAYIVQRMQMESLDNLLFMGMLSYNNESLPVINVNGFKIRYADPSDFSNMIRHIRKYEDLPRFRYMAVSEFGGKKHRPHWHFIISIPKSYVADIFGRVHLSDCLDLERRLWSIFLKYWRRNYGSRKFPDWRPLLTYKCRGNKRNYDLHFIDTISGVADDAAFYTTKYSTKYDKYTDRLKSALYFNLKESDFLTTWKLVKPRTLWSKGFGDPTSPNVINHVCDGIDRSIMTEQILPLFFNPNTGQSFPLSPYYQKKYLTEDVIYQFKLRQLESEKINPDIYETTLRNLVLKRTQERIASRSEDPTQFIDIDDDTNELCLTDFDLNGNTEENFILDEFSFDEWEDY